MMSKEQREAARVRWNSPEIISIPKPLLTGIAYQDITAALDALADMDIRLKNSEEANRRLLDDRDRLKAENERLNRECELHKNMYIKAAHGKCEADARVAALERALNYPGCSNPECHWYTPCDTCKADSDFCKHLCADDEEDAFDMSEACPFWQFDESRFAEGSD